MPVRTAQAKWNGDLIKGTGLVKLGSGAFKGNYSFASRFESGEGTNPEELIGAAHSGCFSMALAAALAESGFKPESVETAAKVHIDKVESGFAITLIELDTAVKVPGIDNEKFQNIAEAAKIGCPVSKALAATPIQLTAKLV